MDGAGFLISLPSPFGEGLGVSPHKGDSAGTARRRLLFNPYPHTLSPCIRLREAGDDESEAPPRVDDATGDFVLAGEDAAPGVGGGVARVDADALPLAVECLVADDLGQPLAELGTPRDDYGVFALGDGRETGDFHFAVGVVPPRGFEGVAQVAFAAPFRHLIKAAYRVGRLLCNAFQ